MNYECECEKRDTSHDLKGNERERMEGGIISDIQTRKDRQN